MDPSTVERDEQGVRTSMGTRRKRPGPSCIGCGLLIILPVMWVAWVVAEIQVIHGHAPAQAGVVERVPAPLAAKDLPIEPNSTIAWDVGEHEIANKEEIVAPSDVRGRLLGRDCNLDGDCVYLTASRRNQLLSHRLYWQRAQDQTVTELTGFRGMETWDPTLLRRGGEAVMLVYRRNDYYPVKLSTFVRIFRSRWDESLRPEETLHLYDPARATIEYIGPGYGIIPSPDRTKAAFLRTGNYFYSLHVWYPENNATDDLISMWEADPGSGRSFSIRWSTDSRFLKIEGFTFSYRRDGEKEPDHVGLPLVIDTVTQRVYQAP